MPAKGRYSQGIQGEKTENSVAPYLLQVQPAFALRGAGSQNASNEV